MSAKAVLLKAADILRTDGWCQFQFIDSQGRRCVRGALIAAARDQLDDSYRDARSLLQNSLGRRAISVWNDEPGRTVDEVITALEEAAK